MGRDWYYKSRSSGGGGTSNKSAARRRSSSTTVEKETHLGCISSVFHLFDFHQFQCVFSGAAHDQHQHHQPPDINPAVPVHPKSSSESSKNDDSLSDHHSPPPKGVEAPRNSLELQEGPSSSSSSAMKEEDHDSSIPFSVLQLVPLKPSSSSSSDREAKPFSDDTNSQGSKTPNLVARLMGLDLLPSHHHDILSATSSPLYRRSSVGIKCHHHQYSSQKENNVAALTTCSRYESGTRSLPDTPRISSARRSDVAPRLSLQVLNRENTMCTSAPPREFDQYRGVPSRESLASLASSSPVSSSRSRRRRRDMKLMKVYEDESKISPSKYAMEMVKQVKESVSRKFGADITNSDTRDCEERIHSPTTVLKLRKINTGNGGKPPDQTTSGLQRKHTSCTAPPSSRSPRFRGISKQKSGSPKPAENLTHKPQIPPEFSRDQCKPVLTNYYSETLKASKSKATQTSSSSSPLPKPTTQCKKASCERFTRSKPKKAPPSETFESLRTEGLPRNGKVQAGAVVRSSQEDSAPSCSGKAAAAAAAATAAPLGVRDDNGAEFRYVRAIVERSRGSESWYSSSPSHRPLEYRSLFHALEREGMNWYSPPPAGPMSLKSYRALLFDLADEVLAGVLKKERERRRRIPAGELVEAVWGRMSGFPGANCKTLQDIDALVGLDMGAGEALEEEVELVAAEIEREVVESLVAEAAGAGAVTAGR